jgi:undecaprenyl-diphosphatase
MRYTGAMPDIIQAILLGAVQAVTEFIPVSSSAHLILAQEAFAARFSNLAYDVVLHLGTVLALMVYFWSDIRDFVRHAFIQSRIPAVLIYIGIATVPAAVAGFFWLDVVEAMLRSLWVIVIMLLLVSLFMFFADHRRGERELKDMTWKDALLIGLAQAVSLIPGTSRSGSTIVAGSILKFQNAVAAQFSFYLAIPIVLGANLRMLFHEGVAADILAHWSLYLIGAVVAASVGYGVIAALLRYLRTHSLALFAWYRILLALILVGILVL